MTTAPTITGKASQITAEQAEADAMEGIRPVTDAEWDLIKRHNALVKRMAPLKKELEAIKELIKESMTDNRLRNLTHDGVEVATLSTTNRTGFDKKGAIAELGIDVIGEFITTSSSTTLRIK